MVGLATGTGNRGGGMVGLVTRQGRKTEQGRNGGACYKAGRWKRNRGGMIGLATRVGGEQGTERYGRVCYRNKEKGRRNGRAYYKAGEGNTEQGRNGGHATREGTGNRERRAQ